MADFYLKRHDLLPALQVICQDSTGAAVNLTGATAVFNMILSTAPNTLKIARATATIVNAAAGIVQYNWTGTDTDTSGTYWGEFEVDFSGPKPETFPNTTNIIIQITDDID